MEQLKYIDVEQNTDQWLQLRSGRITMSAMNKVMANYGKAFGSPAKQYAVNIAIEQITGEPILSSYQNEEMKRGHTQEPIARVLYESETFQEVRQGGFFCNDTLGFSPDGVVGDSGIIEIKSVLSHVHFANVKRRDVDPAYKWQVLGALWATGRDWVDFISYCSTYPKGKQLYVFRLKKNDYKKEFEMLSIRVDEFKDLVRKSKETIESSEYFLG